MKASHRCELLGGEERQMSLGNPLGNANEPEVDVARAERGYCVLMTASVHCAM